MIKGRSNLINSLVALFVLPLPTMAADEIYVEGLRLRTGLDETGTSVSIITAQEIEKRGLTFAVDALAIAPGVTVNQNGAFGGLASVRIRGAASDQTLVLLDGVPIGDPTSVGGGYDFSIFDVNDIERIEVLKGPQSTLWGSDAIGGVVNIITKKPDDGLSARAFAEAGSFKTYRGGASVSARNDTGDFRLSATGLESDGISKADASDGNGEADAYHGLTLSARGALNLPRKITLEATTRYMEGETEIDGFPPPDFTLADSDDFSETRQLTSTLGLSVPLFNETIENDFFAGYTDVERLGNFGGFETRDQGDRLILRYQGRAEMSDRHQIAIGAEHEASEANGEATDITGFFGLYQVKPIEPLTITAGLRHDDHSRFGGATTAQLGVNFAINEQISLRASWGEGFKAPSIFQLTQTFGAFPPNSALLPEESEAFDLGADYISENGVRASLTYFNRDTENQITFAPNFRYENLEKTKAQGVEISFAAPVAAYVSFMANYAYIDAEDAITGERQIRIPRHSGDAGLTYDNSIVSGTLSVRYNGDERDNLFGTDVDDWVRVDAALAYRLSPVVEFYGRIENLFDEQYQQVSGFGTPGLSAYSGVRVRL